MSTSSSTSPELVQRLIIFVVVLAVGLFLGTRLPSQPTMAMALVVFFALVFLLFARPAYFILLLLFFLFEAFNLVDVHQFGRLPGLFRAKDLLMVMTVGYVIANASLRNTPSLKLRESSLFKPLAWLMIFLAFQMVRTRFLLHESPLLLFRQGRHYLTYGLPFVLFHFVRRENDWRNLDRFAVLFIGVTTILNALEAAGVPLPFYQSVGREWLYAAGVFKSYNPAGPLVYWFFYRCFWRFCHEPQRASALKLGASGLALAFYFHRGSLAGSLIGMMVILCLVPGRVRFRGAAALVFSGIALVLVTVAGVAFSETVSWAQVGISLRRYLLSTGTDLIRVEGTYRSRVMQDAQRYPLVRQHPILGIGFLSMFGSVAYEMWKTGGVLPVGTVDTGWLDLMLRLGGLGTALLLVLLVQCARICWRLYAHDQPDSAQKGILLANINLIVMTVTSAIAGGALVWEPGITTVALAMAWTVKIEHDLAVKKSPPPPVAELPRLVPPHNAGRASPVRAEGPASGTRANLPRQDDGNPSRMR